MLLNSNEECVLYSALGQDHLKNSAPLPFHIEPCGGLTTLALAYPEK